MKLHHTHAALFSAVSATAAAAAADTTTSNAYPTTGKCKCFPGDDCWPSEAEWSRLNETVDGRLIKTVPLGSPCHDPNYDEDGCAKLREEWLYSSVHISSSSSVMAPLFANDSCDPFSPRTQPCEMGNYVSYAVDVGSPSHVAAAMKFASEKDVRLVVRNTGHDYLGRSTGAGGLAVWMQGLKGVEVLDYDDDDDDDGEGEEEGKGGGGKAIKMAAGTLGYEALEVANGEGLVVVTGECPSVGLAGGYTQGGGHSALSTKYGLAADNVLEFEVVVAKDDEDGDYRVVTASRTGENQDLYWALAGGGPGNYGVVTSMTVRAHLDEAVGGASLAFQSEDPDQLYQVIDAFHDALPDMVAKGTMVIYYFGRGFIQVPALTWKGAGSKADVEKLLDPFIQKVKDITTDGTGLGSVNITHFDSYHEHYDHYWGPLPEGNIQVGTMLFGGRMIPRDSLAGFGPAARKLVEMGVTFIGVGLDVSSFGGGGGDDDGYNNNNAVFPGWRRAIVASSLTLPWSNQVPFSDMVREQERIRDEVGPVAEEATGPHAGVYMNEADVLQPDWQREFFGSEERYGRLLDVKRRWDPSGLLYVPKGVGSEGYEVDEGRGGRLCRTGWWEEGEQQEMKKKKKTGGSKNDDGGGMVRAREEL